MEKICFIAYAEYFNDARIKTYVNSLLSQNYEIDLFCLYDEYSAKKSHHEKNFKIYFVNKKYQGNNKFYYLINYIFFFIKCFVSVTVKFFQKKYSIFHVHNQPDFLVFIPFIPKIFGSKIILDLHDIMIAGVVSKFNSTEDSLIYKLTKLQTVLSIKFCDALIYADDSQKEFMIERGISHDNTYVFLNLPDEKIFSKKIHQLKTNGAVKLVFHGTIAERLGLDLVIKAVEIANNKINLSLTIIGDGDQKDQLIKYAQDKDILDRIIFFKPFIPVEHLQKEIEKYDIGVIGNRRSLIADKCMLPVKLMEYLYIGLPVIVPRLEVIQRYFSDQMVEFYEADNIHDLSNKILDLAGNEKKRNLLVENSRVFFENYNLKEQKQKYTNLIESLTINI